MSVGKIGPFDVNKDSWDLYIERLEQYFIVNDVKDAVKVATLITVIGSEAYELMVNLCTPKRPATKTYSDLVAVMKTHLQPKPSILAERYKFRQRRQSAHENIAEYAAALKKLSMTCSFSTGNELQDNLRDQFVCGLAKDDVRQRLFADDNITFENAFKLAVTMETAVTNAAAVETREGRRGGTAELYQMTRNRVDRSGSSTSGVTRMAGDARVVRGAASTSYTGGGSARVTKWKTSGTDSSGSGNGGGSVRQPAAGGCTVCGAQHAAQTCKFRMYVCRVCNREGHLKRVCPRLRLRNEQMFAVYETAQSDQWIGGNSEGSDEVFINNFSIISNFSRFKTVFEDGLGRFTGGPVGFRLRADARPVFLRARPLAYALREPVERALDQLVRDGVLTPVHTSDWATPIVPVLKKDGTIRVCGDFKLTLNKFLEVDRFPLPRVEDLLTKLHGGQKFTKLDLSQAYAQFELDDSKQYAVINTHKGDLPLILTTDASSVGVGAVISQLVPGDERGPGDTRGPVAEARERPVAYASRALNQAERGYSQIEREADLQTIYPTQQPKTECLGASRLGEPTPLKVGWSKEEQ
ncbi:uncharacterized protein [Choristoneura fumiferana]|uniref:uncharacterized protein n=1 Tax=Choristoneura fumiferana TaxID=7141 RepID=UPI003D15BECE